MKNFVLQLVFSCALLFLSGCSSNSDESEIIECPQGFSGLDCDIQITPSKIEVTKIVIRLFPYLNSDQEMWDNDWDDNTGEWPDIFIGLASENEILLLSDAIIDVNMETGDIVITPNFPVEMPDLYGPFSLGIFDLDGENYELMSDTYFSLYDPNAGFPEYITLKNDLRPTIADIYLNYKW